MISGQWCKEWRQRKPTVDKILDSRPNDCAAQTPTAESRNCETGGKKADRCREAVLCDWKRGNPPSCPPTPWRALREGELPRSSSDFKLEERCSWSRRAPLPRPRPAPRCLKFVYFSTNGETNRGFWKRLNILLGEGLKWCTWTKFCSLLFLAATRQLSNLPLLLRNSKGGALGMQYLWQREKRNYSVWGLSIKFSIALALNWPPTYSSNWVFIYVVS